MKRLLRLLPILLIIAALALPLIPAQVVLADPGWLEDYTYRSQIPITGSGAGSPPGENEDYYNTGDDGQVWGARPTYYVAQSFTTTDAYTTATIKVKTFRAGNPGTINVGIRNVDGEGKPTGSYLTYGTYNSNTMTAGTGGAWYTISVGSYTLATSTQYCIVIEVPSGDVNNYLFWKHDGTSPTYTGGAIINMNAGVWQSPDTSKDRMFEVWSIDADAIDVGLPAIDRTSSSSPNYTVVAMDNPSNNAGTIETIELWAETTISNCEVATFFVVSGNNLSTRDTEVIGTVTAGKQTFDVDLTVQVGDYIGIYFTAGTLGKDASGYGGMWYTNADDIPCTNTLFTVQAGAALSIYGVTYATIGAGKYYTVSLEVHSGSGSNSDGVIYLDNKCEDFPKDIRFTKYSSAEIIPYWLEPGSGSPRTFHIQVPTNLDNNQNIYVYFGNSVPTAFDVPPFGLWEKATSAFGPDKIVHHMVYDSVTDKYYIVYNQYGGSYPIGLLSANSPTATSWTDEGTMVDNNVGDPTIFKYGGLWYIVYGGASSSIHYSTATSITGPYTYQGVLKTGATLSGIFYNEVNGRWELLSMLYTGVYEQLHLYYSSTLTGSYTAHGGNPVIPQGEPDMYDEIASSDPYGYVFTDNIGGKHSNYYYTTGRKFAADDEQRCVIAYTDNDFTKRGVILYYDTSSYDKTVIKGGISRFGDYYYTPFGTVSGGTRYYAVAKMYAKSTDSGFPPQQVFIAYDDFSKTNPDQWSQRWGTWSISSGELTNTQNDATRLALMNNMAQPDDAWEYSVKLKRVDLLGRTDTQCTLGVAHAVRDQPGANALDCYVVTLHDGYYKIGKYINNAWSTIQDWTSTTVDVDEWNTLTIRHTDDNGAYTVLLNDTPIYSGITAWDEGSFGVIKEQGASVWDDFKVTKYASTASSPVVGTPYTAETTEIPAVTTNEAVDKTGSSATLQGTLTTLGEYSPVYVSFEYGLTTAYGTTTSDQTKTATGGFNQAISGLTPDTTYHFRARARYDGAYVYGADETFVTTALSPPTVTTNDASGVAQTTATLHGTLTSLGDYSPVYVSFEYGTTTAYADGPTVDQSKTSTGVFEAPVSGLTANTLYHFRAKVKYDSSYVYGADNTFTTPAADTPVITTGIATNIGDDSATLQGTLSSLGSYSPVYVYFQYGATPSYGITTAEQSKTATSSFSQAISGLAPSATYHFRAVVKYDTSYIYGADKTLTTTAEGPPAEPGIDPPDVLRIDDIKVFTNYFKPGDQLYVIAYRIIYDGGDPILDVSDYFDFQLLDGVVLRAQVPIKMWNYKPGSIYLQPDSALAWGGNYRIKIIGVPNRWETPPECYRDITAGDWQGSDLTQLDTWVISTAGSIQSQSGYEVLTYTTVGIPILTPYGGTIFNMGILGLSTVRPHLFVPTWSGFPVPTPAVGAPSVIDPEARTGSYVYAMLEDAADLVDMEPTTFGGLFFGIMWLVVAVIIGMIVRNGIVGLGLASPVIILGAWFGLIPMALIAIAACIFVMYTTLNVWMKGT